MKRTYVYKLRPNHAQAEKLAEILETCRRLYNVALSERKEAWENEERSVSFAAQCGALPELKKSSCFLRRVHSQVLQNVLRRVDRSYQNFFRRLKNGERAGYPRFKGQGWYDSFCYPQYGNGAKLEDGRLVLSKIGRVRVTKDRRFEGTPKTVTIVRKADGWYAHVTCEVDPKPLEKTGKSVGIDVGIASFATLSTGEKIENPRCLEWAERKLKKAQRRLSRRRKGSRRRAKARKLLAKAHQKVRRARRDHAHKAAFDFVRRFDRMIVEDFSVRNMVKNHYLAKHISDAGWAMFVQILSDKAESAGREVVKVNPQHTSQVCSGCGKPVPKPLSIRWHSCSHCGCELDRDHNAAINILKAGGGTAFGEPVAMAPVMNREPHSL